MIWFVRFWLPVAILLVCCPPTLQAQEAPSTLLREVRLLTTEAVGGGQELVRGVVFLTKKLSTEQVVQLEASSLDIFDLPDEVKLPAGRTAVTFSFHVKVVAANTPVTFSARVGRGLPVVSKPLTVLPVSVESVTIQPQSLVGGHDAIGFIQLEGTPKTRMLVTFSVKEPAHVDLVEFQNSKIQVSPEAKNLYLPFTLFTKRVTQKQTVNLEVTANGRSKSFAVTLTPQDKK